MSVFERVNTIDTCSIWKILSSPQLVIAARAREVSFLVAEYVRYEALEKRRTNPSEREIALRLEFRSQLQKNRGFAVASLSVADLQAIANLPETRKLGQGEIAAMALANKVRAAFLTDDQPARRIATRLDKGPVQTTPHLLGRLVYVGQLTDGDVTVVIREHDARIAGRLTVYFQEMYHEGLRRRLVRDG